MKRPLAFRLRLLMADDTPMADAAPGAATTTTTTQRGTDLVKLEADIQVQLQAAAQVRGCAGGGGVATVPETVRVTC